MSGPLSDLPGEPRPVDPTVYRFAFHGTAGSFFLIFLKNILLTMGTLGAYLPWAKTERRRYVWNNATFHDEHFRYTGTGVALFKGYLVVGATYMTFLGLPALVNFVAPAAAAIVRTSIGIAVFLAVPFLIYRSRGFLYNRTVWRGIRFGLVQDSGQYAKTFLIGSFLTLLTLGLYLPVMRNRLYRIITDNTRFGSLEFHYTGSDREVFWIGVKGILLSVLTLGIYSFWYSARITRYQLEHTRVGETATLRSELRGADLLLLTLLSAIAIPLTLGLAFPWITMYSIRLIAERTSVHGVIDFETIEQRARDAGAVADGFAGALDIDLGL